MTASRSVVAASIRAELTVRSTPPAQLDTTVGVRVPLVRRMLLDQQFIPRVGAEFREIRVGSDDRMRRMALEYAEYYVGMLRENGGKSAECLAAPPQ